MPQPYTYHIKTVTKVVDGDTIDCSIDLGFSISYDARIRLAGIDTPEVRTRNLQEKEIGFAASAFLSETLSNATQILVTTDLDDKGKFGRILGTIWADGVNVNQLLCDNHYAVEYHGQNRDDLLEQHLSNREILISEGKIAT